MLPGQSTLAPRNRGGSSRSQVTAIRDHQTCIPLTSILEEDDIVLLLTPVVTPVTLSPEQYSIDPFETLGRALAAKHPWIRHVPYTARNGITNTHVSFIRRARVVIFVVSGRAGSGQLSQLEIAQASWIPGDDKIHIIIACCDFQEFGMMEVEFPTIIQIPGYLPEDLETAAAVLFGESTDPVPRGENFQDAVIAPKYWPPENWDGPDISPVHDLWNQCLPEQFHLEKFPLQNLLRRDGYSMHFIVKLPETHEIIGFCATYTTFVDKDEERLNGSLAMIMVKPRYRRQGVGLSLYEHAVKQLKRIRGVDRIQLGSTYPRLLSGIPLGFPSGGWFQRRGWPMDRNTPGRGQHLCDWLLKIEDWPEGGLSTFSSGLAFRQGTFEDVQSILTFIENESTHKDHTGWYDQYMNLAHDGRLNDVILGLDRSRIVASALIYTTHDGSPLALNLPWARTIGPDVGGVTCISIGDDCGALSSKDTVMIRLLDACITVLKDQGMKRIYLDAIKGGDEGFQSMGFHKWAVYCENWQQA
ncbi:hypothetical protein F5Y16DRAFT_210105 [Xylariaceae sp. FL0255]|nr:hypothetical protein F5Y16DRAFT_210105 [Xylariaceae sp. FL0255]